jgi:hypothetical protein
VIAHLKANLPPHALLVNVRLRYNSLPHYAEHHGLEMEIVLPEDVDDTTDFDRPVAYVVDMTPLDDGDWGPEWELRRFGTATLLYRAEPRPGKEQAFADMHRITVTVLGFLRGLPEFRDWVWWRLDTEHEHLLLHRATAIRHKERQEGLFGGARIRRRPTERVRAGDFSFQGLIGP